MIREDFLHYLWKYKYFAINKLYTTTNEAIQIINAGEHNINSGPDFFNAKIIIDKQIWAGNVEIHVKSSDWYLHHHENDSNYDNVILHVVWQHDVDIYQKNNNVIPTLELQNFTSLKLLNNYKKLFSKKIKFINCENDISTIKEFTINNWLEKVYIEKLEQKSGVIYELLKYSKNDWESVLFKLLAKNFGLKVNGDSFLNLANSIDFKIIRKEQFKLINIEALFFGQAGFLQEDKEEIYYQNLKNEYDYIKLKYHIVPLYNSQFQFFRLRPNNFPTIRLAQLAALYSKHHNLFSKIMDANSLEDFYKIFDIKTSMFWEQHYHFNSKSIKRSKKLTKPFIDLLIINSIIPIKFVFQKQMGKLNEELLLNQIRNINPEKNNIITKFYGLNIKVKNAMESQALLLLKNEYCNKHLCLQCAIGNALLRENSI